MGRLFGTDGARGIAITELTCELAMQIGRAASIVLTKKMSHKPTILIGKDTRISSDILESALVAGICSVGANAKILGVVPTPAAYLVRKEKADAGVMISASHNSVEFNGIKLFSATGYKLSDDIEEEIEALILDRPQDIKLCSHGEVGRVIHHENARQVYIDYIANTVNADVSNMKVAIDCANGSSSATAKDLFSKLGVKFDLIHAEPDGININDNCGSTHMESLMKLVREGDYDLGLAFDGDADRCLAVDENGDLVDGDKLIAICSKAYKEEGRLKNNTAVVTVMTNLGFSHFAKANNIDVITSSVGDRYVLEKMLEGGYNIGGEQSGHIIFLDHSTTGDGELSGAMLLSIMKRTGEKLSDLAKIMERYPQVLINVKVSNEGKLSFYTDKEVKAEINRVTEILGDTGRILVRVSGTEPLVRVMLEGENLEQIQTLAEEAAQVVRERLA